MGRLPNHPLYPHATGTREGAPKQSTLGIILFCATGMGQLSVRPYEAGRLIPVKCSCHSDGTSAVGGGVCSAPHVCGGYGERLTQGAMCLQIGCSESTRYHRRNVDAAI